jgi:class 3 adenylate cyclase/HEAT repeat protein
MAAASPTASPQVPKPATAAPRPGAPLPAAKAASAPAAAPLPAAKAASAPAAAPKPAAPVSGAPSPAAPLAAAPSAAKGAEAAPLGVEPVLTTHRIFETCDPQKKGLETLHADMFDSRLPVALSALSAVQKIADTRSFPHVARLLSSNQEDLQCGAARAMGALQHPDAVRLLLNLDKTTRSDKLRRAVLEALAAAAPANKEVVEIIHGAARTPMGSPGARAHAAGLLLRVGGETALEELLTDSREEILNQILASAAEDPALAPRTVGHFAVLYPRLPAHARVALVALAARQDIPEAAGVLREAVGDPHTEVRRAAYEALGTEAYHKAWLTDILSKTAVSIEANPALEDEAQQAIARMEKLEGAADAVQASARSAVMSRVGDLYKQLSAEGRNISSDTHELGWLIMRSKEYLEYYGNEDFKAALLRWLKGTSSDTVEGLLRMAKATAVRVEVRHFDGFSAISDLIKNPKRNGISLVTRELAMAKTGKIRQFWQLVRVCRLATVFLSPSAAGADSQLFNTIFKWARQEKLFRLADAALNALGKADPATAEAACLECVKLPLSSKILAITSLHLLRVLHPELLEPSTTRLLASQDDPYITMNALEAMSAGPPSASGELAKALLTRLSFSSSAEVRESIVAYMGEKLTLDVTESIKEPALNGGDELKAAALSILERRITAGLVTNRDGTIEFLYRILRGSHETSRRSAALMLWKMGDEYSVEVLRDMLASGSEEAILDILLRLRGSLRESLVYVLGALLARDSVQVQAALRDLFIQEDGKEVRDRALEIVLQFRGAGLEQDEGEEPLLEENAPAVELRSERTAFQFERENMQELVMFFSDIVGYSKKAQVLSPQQLSTLIQEYEKILLTHIESHGGELIKRMGDGHMIVFQDAIAAVLAAIRLQKALKRFNRYRDENTRAVIRVGIHVGNVVRKAGGDVLGNAVNIASRLESSAPHGSVLISDLVYAKVKDAVHAREIGHITVKNISEPIQVFEPYEIVMDLPAELDPLKQTRSPAHAGQAVSGVTLDRETYVEIARCFSALIAVCRGAENGRVTLAAINEQVLKRWNRLRPKLPGLAPAKKE